MLAATGADRQPHLAPIVELVKMLASDLDQAFEQPTIALYRAALVELNRSRQQLSTGRLPSAHAPDGENDLTRFRRARGLE